MPPRSERTPSYPGSEGATRPVTSPQRRNQDAMPRTRIRLPRVAGRLGRALRHRNYRLFFAGQGISVIGTWLTQFAMVWMAYDLTNSALIFGLVGFFGQAPTSILAPFAGVMVDRWNRHRTILVTQIAAMLQSAALAFFAWTHMTV